MKIFCINILALGGLVFSNGIASASCDQGLLIQSKNSIVFTQSIKDGGVFFQSSKSGAWNKLEPGLQIAQPSKLRFVYILPKEICSPEFATPENPQFFCEKHGFLSVKVYKNSGYKNSNVFLEHGEEYNKITQLGVIKSSIKNYQNFHNEKNGNKISVIKSNWHQQYETKSGTIKTYEPYEKKATFLYSEDQEETGFKKVRLFRFSTPSFKQVQPVCVPFTVTWQNRIIQLDIEVTLLNPTENEQEFFPLKLKYQKNNNHD